MIKRDKPIRRTDFPDVSNGLQLDHCLSCVNRYLIAFDNSIE